jgi:hypothetical protein
MTEPPLRDEPTDHQDSTRETPRADTRSRTGHERVDAALAELTRIGAMPPAGQVAGYALIHRELSETLAALDDGR